MTRMRVLLREEELTAKNRLLNLDGKKIERSAEALLNLMVLSLSPKTKKLVSIKVWLVYRDGSFWLGVAITRRLHDVWYCRLYW
jgi:hypothetical protein